MLISIVIVVILGTLIGRKVGEFERLSDCIVKHTSLARPDFKRLDVLPHPYHGTCSRFFPLSPPLQLKHK